MRDPTETKEIKVKLPKEHHIKLHSIRILHGITITEIVTNALNEYFEKHAEELRPSDKNRPRL